MPDHRNPATSAPSEAGAPAADTADTTGPVAVLIVGGGPAGLSAARAYREGGGEGRVLLLSADRHPPYNRPPLSKDFLRGESEAESLPLQSDSWYAEQRIAVLLNEQAVALDPAARTMRTTSGRLIDYYNVVLALGSAPVVPPIPGADHPGVLMLRSMDQAYRLRRSAEQARTAVVIGSGFIGCEAAVSLALRGLQVDLVTDEKVPQAVRLGAEAGHRILGWLTEAGVRVHTGATVAAIMDGRTVDAGAAGRFEADLVLVAAGAAAQGGLAESAGLAMDHGRIVVDARMATSVPQIFAAGDIVAAYNGAAGRRLHVEHWGEALRMGEVAGKVLAGRPDEWAQVPGFWSGIGEHTLKYAAWGDGFDTARLVDHGGGAFTVWYGRDGRVVGVLTHRADEDFDSGSQLIEDGGAVPA